MRSKLIQERLFPVPDRQTLEKFAAKKYRDGYLQSRVRGFTAYQIQALREKLGLTQDQFAELTGKKQSTISRVENTEYGKVSVQTLLDIACATDVALIVKFASYPEFLDQTRNMSVEALQPRTIQESLSERQSAMLTAEFNRWLRESSPYSPPLLALRSKIIETIDSAAASSEPIKQRPAPSLLDEELATRQHMPRQNIRGPNEMMGATWS
jgi:transcriptional regulator with XRE-family HTH domain